MHPTHQCCHSATESARTANVLTTRHERRGRRCLQAKMRVRTCTERRTSSSRRRRKRRGAQETPVTHPHQRQSMRTVRSVTEPSSTACAGGNAPSLTPDGVTSRLGNPLPSPSRPLSPQPSNGACGRGRSRCSRGSSDRDTSPQHAPSLSALSRKFVNIEALLLRDVGELLAQL